MGELSYPVSLDAITTAWLSSALSGSCGLGQVKVASFEASDCGAGIGFMGAVLRLNLTYDGAAPGAPTSIIAKLPSSDAGALNIASTFRHYEKEIRFYDDIQPNCAMPAPRAYFQAFDADSGTFALLMEDLAPARNGNQLEGLTFEEAASAVRAVAKLQAQWWETDALHALTWLPGMDDPMMLALEPVFQQCWGPYKDFLGDKLPEALKPVGDKMCHSILKMEAILNTAPVTLIHGDYRADNFFFGADPSQLTVIDWQIITKGRGAFDLAYMIGGNLSVENRRAWERQLVQLYVDTLAAEGVKDYAIAQAWEDYRFCVMFGWIWPVVAIGSLDPTNERGMALFFEWSRRVSAALLDLNCAETIPD